MKSTTLVAGAVAAVLISSPVLAPTASAQPAPPGGSSPSYIVPLVIGAAAGATVGALLWPAMVPAAGAAVAAPAAAQVGGWGWGAFFTTRAAVGAIIGGGLGYLAAR
jgi:hypothetical protein